MFDAKKKKLFAQIIRQNKKFLISGHQGPDGDVVGSTLALALALKKLGKKAFAYNHDGCPQNLRWLPKADIMINKIPAGFEDGVLITVDSGDLARLGSEIESYKFHKIMNIDHHQSNTRFGDYNFVDVKAGSTGQVVHDLLGVFCSKLKISSDIAQNIFCTLSTDTGSFRYSNATPEVFNLAAHLVERGAKPEVVSEALYETYPQRRLHLLARVIQSLKFEFDGQLAVMVMTNEDMKITGAKGEDAEEFVNMPRGVVGVKIVCFVKERNPTEWKFSLRTRGAFDVLKIAQKFGGGGHKVAAGCTVMGTRDEAINQVIKEAQSLGYFG